MKRFIQKGDIVHVYNRGNRKMPIVNNEKDKWRFLKTLRYFNDHFAPANLFRKLHRLREAGECGHFQWPSAWPSPNPLVKILDYCLMPNHFHLLLEEVVEGDISQFMARFSNSFTKFINTKYDVVGSLFQGPYKSKIIRDEQYYGYLDAYIQVCNPFELYPGGFAKARENFDKAFQFALDYPFNSLAENFGERNLGIVEQGRGLATDFSNIEEYKEFAREVVNRHRDVYEVLGPLSLE